MVVFELTCPWDSNITRSHNFKSEKYAPLVADLSRNFIVHFFSVEISARGQVTKENQSRLKSFLFKSCNSNAGISKSLIRISSKAALLSSYSIFSARREPTWENHSLSLCMLPVSTYCPFYFSLFVFNFSLVYLLFFYRRRGTLVDDLYQTLSAH